MAKLQFRSRMANIAIFEIDPLVCPKFSSTSRLIAFIEDPAMIKMILKHLNLLDVKRKPRPTATPPSVYWFFPTYDDQPGVDDYITDLDSSAEAYFKTTTGLLGFLRPKSQIFSQLIAKFRLDNTTGIRYLNPSRLLPQYGCCFTTDPTSHWNASCYGTEPRILP